MSLLLNGFSTTERTAQSNTGFGGYEVTDVAKSIVKSVCPRIGSCVDMLEVTALDASIMVISYLTIFTYERSFLRGIWVNY